MQNNNIGLGFQKSSFLVSVIIPTYNRSKLVCRAIESVFNQTYPNVEIIVVDDGSTDDTSRLINKKFGDSVKYLFQENRGAPAARNLGFKNSIGKYINFLDSDDYFLPHNIEEKVQILEKNNDISWVFSDRYININKKKILNHRNPILEELNSIFQKRKNIFDIVLLYLGKFTSCHTVLMRRECLEELGGWDEKLLAMQDVDLFIRLSKNFNVKYIHKPLVVQMPSSDSISNDIDNRLKSTVQIVEKVNFLFSEEIKKRGISTEWKKLSANFYNLYGKSLLSKKRKRKAQAVFIKSIITCPIQKSVYFQLIKSVI